MGWFKKGDDTIDNIDLSNLIDKYKSVLVNSEVDGPSEVNDTEGNLLKQTERILEKMFCDNKKLQSELDVSILQQEALDSIINKLEQELEEQRKQKTTNPVKFEGDLTSLSDVLNSLNEQIVSIRKKINETHDKVDQENIALIKDNEAKQGRLEQIIQNSQEDRYRKDKAKLIKRSIFQMALIRKTLYEFESQNHLDTDKERVDFLVEQLNNLLTFSETTLEQEMIERIEPAKEGSGVCLEQQEVIGYHTTENKELDGKVYRSVNPAYVWCLPYILKAKINESGDVIKTYRFLLESEQVIIYKIN